MSYDFEEASLLLNVARESLGYPQLRPLHDAAVVALEEMLPKPEVEAPTLAKETAFDVVEAEPEPTKRRA